MTTNNTVNIFIIFKSFLLSLCNSFLLSPSVPYLPIPTSWWIYFLLLYISFSFLEFYVNKIIQYDYLLDWLPSCIIFILTLCISSWSVVVSVVDSYLLPNSISLYGYITMYFTHSPIDWHFDYFQVLAVAYKAALNIPKQILIWACISFSLQVQWLDLF